MSGHDGVRERLLALYRSVRSATEALCQTLAIEDYVVQSMPDASPTRWHLAHTSWFFEAFVLCPASARYQPFDARFAQLFNSYYVAAGERLPRPERGLLSRPTVAEVYAYRRHVDAAVISWLAAAREDVLAEYAEVVELGVNHEEQHQELILTDLKHMFAANPLAPAYHPPAPRITDRAEPLRWCAYEGGLVEIGHGSASFGFDNERPRHRQWLDAYALSDRLVTCGDYLEFISSGGYARPELWLSDGWDDRTQHGRVAPLYWLRRDDEWQVFTLAGWRPLDPLEPVCHVSFYEADAFARWAGQRLATEAEWEFAAASAPVRGTLLESCRFHPAPAPGDAGGQPKQMFGDTWEWVASAYQAYPGFAPLRGALGEYNGKFMSNRMVLRGGSCVTPARHIRATYRNFFAPQTRWQFSGIRLARSVEA